MTQNTGIRPEAELETLLSAALATAFPLVPRDGFTNQKRFTVTLGREPHEVDGMRLWQAEGRADIIISKDGRPLAVVEVKREDKTLTDDDRKQGLSYAALLTPRPPLVIVTNGASTRIYDTASGEPWVRDGDGDEVIAKLFENASKMAAAAMSWAVEALMGPDAGVWASAVRARTKQFIAGQTGEIDDSRKTFASGLCFPRTVTRELREALDEGGRLLLVSGAPLVGKTHVLRELAEAYADSDDFAVFMSARAAARASSSGSRTCFQRRWNGRSNRMTFGSGCAASRTPKTGRRLCWRSMDSVPGPRWPPAWKSWRSRVSARGCA